MMDSPQFCILPGGQFAVQSNGRGRIWTYALPQWERLREVIVWDDGAVGPFAASPIAPLIAVGSFGDGISLRILPSGREAALLPFAAGEVLCLRFSPDGRYLAAGGRFGVVFVYDLSGIVTAQKAGG
jgi:WD40 repeat protein